MRRVALALILALGPASASAGSLFDYMKLTYDAKLTVDGRVFSVMLHKSQDRFLLQPSMHEAFTGMGAPAHWPLPVWRKAAETFVEPVGCGISDMDAISRHGGSWEATYVCPPGVDLRALVAAERKDLRQGLPLHP